MFFSKIKIKSHTIMLNPKTNNKRLKKVKLSHVKSNMSLRQTSPLFAPSNVSMDFKFQDKSYYLPSVFKKRIFYADDCSVKSVNLS